VLLRMMARVGGLVVLVLVLVLSPAVRSASLFSTLARGFETQEEVTYTTLRQPRAQGFEVREYAAKKWVCTLQRPTEAQFTVFGRLFSYIDGNNDRSEKIVMGIPVSIEAQEGSTQMEACFFVPEANQASPPQPTDSRVFITTRPAMTVFTRKFGGYATDEATWKTEAAALRKKVEAAGNTIDTSRSFWNAYDHPIKILGRRNEVWLVQQ